MVQKRDIDHVVPDPSFEVREGRLRSLIQEIITKASQKTLASRICEISGSTSTALFLALLSVEKFKAFGPLTSEHIQGAVITLFILSFFIFIISGTRVILNKTPLPCVEDFVNILKPSESNVVRNVIDQTQQLKLPYKNISSDSDIYNLITYMVRMQGAATQQDVIEHLTLEKTTNKPSETLDSAIKSGFILSSGKSLSLTQEGMDYYRHIAEEEARQKFYGNNIEGDRTTAWR